MADLVLLAADVDLNQEVPRIDLDVTVLPPMHKTARIQASIVLRYWNPETEKVHVLDLTQVAGAVPRLGRIQVIEPTRYDLDFIQKMSEHVTRVDVDGNPIPEIDGPPDPGPIELAEQQPTTRALIFGTGLMLLVLIAVFLLLKP